MKKQTKQRAINCCDCPFKTKCPRACQLGRFCPAVTPKAKSIFQYLEPLVQTGFALTPFN